ncbi:MAG: hypothetical protein ACRD2L_05585, partial [Terriglobia bacterium]
VLYGWEYLEKEFSELAKKSHARVSEGSKVRVPEGLKDTAMFASWLATVKDTRKPLDRDSSNDFITYVGRKSWGTGKWETEGIALKNYRKFWRGVAKMVSGAPFPVRIMPTDSIYYESIPAEFDLPWEEFSKGGLKFKSLPISRIQNKHFIPPFGIRQRRRDGKEYKPQLYKPETADVCIGYLFPTGFAKALNDYKKERLLILTHEVQLPTEERQNRQTAYPGTFIVEEAPNAAATYVLDGKRAWRILDIWDPKKGEFVEQRVEPLDFAKPVTSIAETPITEEGEAMWFLQSSQENWGLFLKQVEEMNPEAAKDLEERGIKGFKAFSQYHSGLFDKNKEIRAQLLDVHSKNETIFNNLLEVLGAKGAYREIEEAAREKFSIEKRAGLTREAEDWV